MSPVYASCPVHGPFQSRLIGGNANGLTLRSNMEPCPHCGRMSRTMEGTFNISDEVVEILSAPPWTKHLLTEVRDARKAGQEAAERANTETELHAVVEQLRTEVAQTNSMLADFIAKETAGKRRDAVLMFLGFLFTVLAWAVPVSEVTGLARDTIAPSIHQLWNQYLNDSSTGP